MGFNEGAQGVGGDLVNCFVERYEVRNEAPIFFNIVGADVIITHQQVLHQPADRFRLESIRKAFR